MKKKKKKKKKNQAHNAAELAEILGLTKAEAALMEYRAKISSIAVEAIESSGMSINEIVKHSGVARSKVSAVKNGATVSVSIDLLIKIIAASGTKLRVDAA